MKIRVRLCAGLAFLVASSGGASADPYRLAPYKDDLFEYPKVIESGYDGDLIRVDFHHQRDVIERDDKPDEKTKAEFVSLDVLSAQADLVLRSGGTAVNYVGVGKTSGGARAVVIFVHGWQATRFDGANDWRSGGNLNRIKNLMVRNGGVYLSPDYALGREQAKRQIKALALEFARNSPGAPIFLACASLGARVCWALLRDAEAAALIDGLVLIAAVGDSEFLESAAVKGKSKPIPIYIAHGTRDSSVSWRPQAEFFRKIKAAAPAYPIRLVLFETGTHRAPLRMIDWRLALNWMLDVNAD